MTINPKTVNDIVQESFDQYELFEKCIIKHLRKSAKLTVQIEARLFRIILGTYDDIIDFYQIDFGIDERQLQEYITMSIFAYAFRDIAVNNTGPNFDNKLSRPYLSFEVYDTNMLGTVRKVANMRNNNQNNNINAMLASMYYNLTNSDERSTGIINLKDYKETMTKRRTKGENNG